MVVDAIQHDQVREHGGVPGSRDDNVLEAALARPQQQWHYSEGTDIASLAAAYGFGFVKNHPYRDGNKRVGLLAISTFLGMNGYDLHATDAEVVTLMLALADNQVSEKKLADWIRTHSTKLK